MAQDKIIYVGKRKDYSPVILKEHLGGTKPEGSDRNAKSRKIIFRTGYLIVPFVLFMLGSCSKWLEIKPESELVLNDYWQTESQATSVLASCYKALTNDACMSRIVLWGEGRSDNVVTCYNDDIDLGKMVTFDLAPTNAYCGWGSFYSVINYCNTFLHYAPGVLNVDKNFTQAKLEQLEAEALTIRALTYFYLVRAFQNVPWVDQPSIDDKQNYYVSQTSDTVVISNIISDLQKALQHAPLSYGTAEENKGRITKNAVMALLADVYLWNNQYAECIQMCDQIIADKNLQLVNTKTMYQDVFYTGNSTESIFELQFGMSEANEQFNSIVYNYYGRSNDYKSRKLSFSNFLAKGTTQSPFNYKIGSTNESSNDARYKDFIDPTFSGLYLIFKYVGKERIEISASNSSYSYRINSANWIVYRLSDIILMKAEALVQLNRSGADLQEALKMVNITYLRSNTASGTDSLRMGNYRTQTELAKLVLRERQRELLFEGKRWFDLMRLARRTGSPGPLVSFIGQKFSGTTSTQIGSNSIMSALYLPIHKYDLSSNPKLKQNPYYDTGINSN
jgi:hypothetical protein